jgi:hypothetical protein
MGRAFCGSVGSLVAAACILSHPAFAQDKKAVRKEERPVNAKKGVPLPAGTPTPRLTDGHPDFSGVWFPGSTGGQTFDAAARRQFDPKVTPEEPPPYQPWAIAKIKAMTSTDYELGRASVNCLPRGVPGMVLLNPYPMQLVHGPGQLVQLNELNNNWRVIATDGRAHDPDPDPGFLGDEVGRWEGDTLAVDTIAIDERTWNDFKGWFHSDQEHVIERFTRKDLNHLFIQVTIEDPKVLTKPWTSAPRMWTLGHEKLQEYFCTNNHEVEELTKLKDKEIVEKRPTKSTVSK